MKFLLIYIFVFSIAIQKLQSQSNTEVLSNKTVTDMYKVGLSKETVVSKIVTSTCKFDVTTTGLIALKKQGLPDDIINAMLEKTTEKNITTAKKIISNSNTATSDINIEMLNYIHTYYSDTIKPLEKSLAASESKRKMMGYGGNDLLLQIEGTTSPVQLSVSNAETFIVNTGSNNMPDFVLYKLKVEKGKRKAVVGKLTISGPKSGENLISVQVTKLKEAFYILKPSQKLEKGEYFFANKPSLNTSTSPADVYAFTII